MRALDDSERRARHTSVSMLAESSSGIARAGIRRLVAIATRRRFGDNEVVFHRGDPADTLHLIVQGRFAARVDSNLGDSVTVSVHGPGDAFGELALLDLDRLRSTTVAALEPATTPCAEDFMRLRQDYPSVHEVLVRLLAARVRRISELYVEALFLDAELLCCAACTSSSPCTGKVTRAPIPLSQHEIAGLAATSRATVNRVLRAEAARGVVALHRGQTTSSSRCARAARGGPVAR